MKKIPQRNLPFLKNLALASGKIILESKRDFSIINKKGEGNFATSVDLKIEKTIIQTIKNSFPNDVVLAEETARAVKNPRNAEHLWIIDPIDGTVNFARDILFCAVGIAYAHKGIVLSGVVYNPFSGDIFYGMKGKGSFHNGKRFCMKSNNNKRLTVITDNSYDSKLMKKHLQLALKIKPTPWLLIQGCALLEICEIAKGSADIFFHTILNPWDIAPAQIILEEAGGVICNFKGKNVDFTSSEIIAGHASAVKKVRRFWTN